MQSPIMYQLSHTAAGGQVEDFGLDQRRRRVATWIVQANRAGVENGPRQGFEELLLPQVCLATTHHLSDQRLEMRWKEGWELLDQAGELLGRNRALDLSPTQEKEGEYALLHLRPVAPPTSSLTKRYPVPPHER